jgi:hypothetical protein
MPIASDIVTVRDFQDSVWQSVVESVAKSEAAKAKTKSATYGGMPTAKVTAPVFGSNALPGHLAAMVNAAHAQVLEQSTLSPELPSDPPVTYGSSAPVTAKSISLDGTKRCASLSLQLAKAKVFGTDEQVEELQNEFNYSVCDPFWVKCVSEYVKHFQIAGDEIPYRAGINNVLPTPIPYNAKIALFGDWGTGTQEAYDLMHQIKGLTPDILMHLGDVYYSGIMEEMQERFLDVCSAVFGSSIPTRFSLSGNHDMYSGGAGFYWLVDELNQGASYFAIQNDYWLFIAMDTGVHDYNPLQQGSASGYLEPSEVEWINGLVANRGTRKVVFLSHHPLFSAFDPIDGKALNTVLLEQLQQSIPNVTAWFWGHEHRLAIYDRYAGLARGRCLGHAAVPVFADETGDAPKFHEVPIHRENGIPLETGVEGGFFKHGFAILKLNGPQATVSYFRDYEPHPLWVETF